MLTQWLARLRHVKTGRADAAGAVEPPVRLSDAIAAAGLDTAAWQRALQAGPRLYAGASASVIASAENGPHAVAAIAQAERILRHEFDLLGSGPFVPVDPDRPARDGYVPIDWYADPVRRLRFPRRVPYKEWKLYEMRPANADIKYPWELARCQHWATLGQAFALTADERFAVEIASQLDDFMEANPVGLGINWTCTMDVALRAVNWAIGLQLVHGSPLSADAWMRAYSALFDHGGFIRANLENTYEVTSNHFLSNVAGLWFLGAVFSDLPDGRAWQTFARESLEQEIDVQVLPDGADFESSIPYHRLVTELFLGCQRLADFQGAPFSPHYRERVRDMVGYLAAVQRPDGLMPQIGDADDGRLHVFSGYGETTPQDARHLFGPAAAMFGVPAWSALAGGVGAWEAAWWRLEPVRETAPADSGSRLFPNAGVAVMRGRASSYLIVTNGIVGTKGFGNHKHNDQLSFEYHPGGTPLIVDPGSFVYTSDPDARNRFRGTASHNTVMIDGIEQNDTRPEWIFRMFESARAEHVSFVDEPDRAEYRGRHHGYERLAAPVSHERTLHLDKTSGALRLIDRLDGSGGHELRWHFHLAPGATAATAGPREIVLDAGGRRFSLQYSDDLAVSVGSGFYSPSYGVRCACRVVELSMHAALQGAREWEFVIAS